MRDDFFTEVTISIHAPREGSDSSFRVDVSDLPDFNPRSP